MDYGRAVLSALGFTIRAFFAWAIWARICPPMGSPALEGLVLLGMLAFVDFVWVLMLTGLEASARGRGR